MVGGDGAVSVCALIFRALAPGLVLQPHRSIHHAIAEYGWLHYGKTRCRTLCQDGP